VTKASGPCRIDGVEVLEVTADYTTAVPRISAKYAYTESASGERMGFGNRNQAWAAETLEAMETLLRCMERDIIGTVFREGTTDGGTSAQDTPTDGVPAL